jgi:hypothetical protein
MKYYIKIAAEGKMEEQTSELYDDYSECVSFINKYGHRIDFKLFDDTGVEYVECQACCGSAEIYSPDHDGVDKWFECIRCNEGWKPKVAHTYILETNTDRQAIVDALEYSDNVDSFTLSK